MKRTKSGRWLQALGVFQPPGGVIEPVRRPAFSDPVPGRLLNAAKCQQIGCLFLEPGLQLTPLPQQRLVRRLERDLALVAVPCLIGDQQARLHEAIDQALQLPRDFGKPRHPSPRRAGFRIDPRQRRNHCAAQQRHPLAAVLRNFWIGVRRPQRGIDRRLDRSLDALQLDPVFVERQIAVGAVVAVQPLQREGEQGKRVLAAAASLDVDQKLVGQSGVDRQLPLAVLLQPLRRPYDNHLVRAARHRRQRKSLLPDSLQLRRGLQQFVGIGADREQDDQIGRAGERELFQQRHKRPGFPCAFGEEQFFALIDRQDERLLRFPVGASPTPAIDETAKQGKQLRRAALD